MKPSLTVLLPVHNAQSTLADQVQKVLEVAADLSQQFELIIIDDGSDDATVEITQELIRRYPQVRTVRHGKPLGREAAIQTGLERCSGEIVLLRDESLGLQVDGIVRLWRAAIQHDIPAWPGAEPGGKSSRPGGSRGGGQAGFQVIDRRSAKKSGEQKPSAAGRPGRPNYMSRLRDFALGE